MPSSTVSLEPLSSPSPSPSPPPPDTHGSTSNNSGAGAGLDSGSELSELTEDEPENSKADREDGRRPTKRKKRGGMIPEPMWGWAYEANKKKDSKTKGTDDEDEEEQLDPRRALEEEEDDERGTRSRSTTTPLPDRRRRRTNGGASAVIRSDDEDDREHDQEDDTASADEASPLRPPDDTANDGDYASEDEGGVAAVRADVAESREPGGGKGPAEASDDENVEDDDGAPADEDPPDDPLNENGAGASDDEAIVPAAPSTAPPSATSSIPHAAVQLTVDRDVDPDTTLMDVDESAPVPTQVPLINAAAASSSIMAGAEVVDPPSPSPSASSASGRNQSRSPSRSPSPEQASDREVEPKRSTAKTRGKPRNGRATRNRTARRKAKGDPDQELEAEPVPEPEQEDADDLDEGDLDSPEMDMELELQPAHRAEALDVLANIELKYALLRESLYVEKMESLSWEEALVHNGIHPEMLHLQAELSNRRDKRLELARLRRDYENTNVTKRRKLDEDGVWSWWKLRRDELQTDMISEAHRKRRQLDRERRVLERPQPLRRIPSPPREIGALPTLRDLVKASPFDTPNSSRRPAPPNALAYPQLSTLAPAEITGDVEFLLGHRRNAGMAAGGLYGLPGVPPGFDQYNIGMPMLDGPGAPNRFPPHMPFQQGLLLPQGVQPPPAVQGYHNLAPPPPPRLQHHHSAPSNSMPMAPQHMMVDQEFAANVHRPGAGALQMQQLPPAGPSSRSRRSLSPVPIHNMSNGSSTPIGLSTKGGRIGTGQAGSSSHGVKEMKRGDSLHHGMESEASITEKERERERRIMEVREREERDWARVEMERERQFRQQRDQEREREQYEREMERSNHMPHPQRHASHTHQHAHNPSDRGSHGHGPHHHHHHHVLHHHHHPNAVNGLGPIANGPPQGIVSREASNGIGPGVSSPRTSRDAELQRGHPVPVEVIELSSSAPLPASSHAYPRKVNEEQPSLHPDSGRDRARGPLGLSAHDRPNPPFVSPPMQSSQSAFPPSPRTAQGLSTAPASVAPSRRGSWSAPDSAPVPRPSSSSSAHLSGLPVSQRLPASALTSRTPQLSPSQAHRSPMLSPPRNSGIRLPPLSPPQTSILRSPSRSSQALPGMPLNTPGASHSKSVSPKVSRRPTPPPPLSRPKSPLTRERSVSGVAPPSIPSGQKHSRMSPVNIFPAPVSQPTPLPTSRLPNGGVDSEAHLASPPKLNAVPID